MGDETQNLNSLRWGLQNGELENVKKIIENQKDYVNKEIAGRCPIHYAADYGHIEVADYLIQKGASVNAPDKFGVTPLLAAIFEGHRDTVKFLLSKGAKKDGKFNDQTYLDHAEQEEIKNLLK